jgi:O-antigen ligase
MEIGKYRRFLRDRGMLWFYAAFIAGYFLLPMAAGHRRLYYFLVFPSVLLLSGELVKCYRGNTLSILLLLYTGYMVTSVLWSPHFVTAAAGSAIWYSVCVLSFVFISGYLWIRHPQRMQTWGRHALWLAGGAALVSIAAWIFLHHDALLETRLEPLGVMHQLNRAPCGYGVFFLLCVHFFLEERERKQRLWYCVLGIILLALILFTQSRGALIAACIGTLVLAGHRVLGSVAVALAASWGILAANPATWEQRVMTLSFRPGIWKQILDDMSGHWWFGHGYASDSTVAAYGTVFDHAHNSYLATLRDGGIVGLALLIAMLMVGLWWAWRLYRHHGQRLQLALLLYGMTCISTDFDRLLIHPKELWLFFWLPVSLVMASYPASQALGPTRYPRSDR